MAAQDWQFGENEFASCGQIDIERNHDELDHAFIWDDYDEDLDGFMTDAQCEDFAKNNTHRGWSSITHHNGKISDERFVHFIFNMDGGYKGAKRVVFETGEDNSYDNEISYVGQAWNDDGDLAYSREFTGNIYSFSDTNDNNVKRNIIDTIKTHLGDYVGCSAYMFVDVGKSFLSRLNEVMDDNDPIFHVINSQCSFADSATEGKELWDTLHFYNNIHCWWYGNDIEVPIYNTGYGENPSCPYNYMFHSGGTIVMENNSNNPNDPIIKQLWYDDTAGTLFTYIKNASNMNKKSGVNADFHKANDADERSICYQRKRSGDGLAIWFMEQFASILLEAGSDADFAHTCGWGEENPDYEDGYGLTDDLDEYHNGGDPLDIKAEIRRKSFFVTGDWPAFCWAAYCHCNAILHTGNNGGEAIIFIAYSNGICY